MSNDRSPAPGSREDLELQAATEVDEMEAEWSTPGEPLDYLTLAAETEGYADAGAKTMDPPDPVYWRAVAAELRRRAAARS